MWVGLCRDSGSVPGLLLYNLMAYHICYHMSPTSQFYPGRLPYAFLYVNNSNKGRKLLFKHRFWVCFNKALSK